MHCKHFKQKKMKTNLFHLSAKATVAVVLVAFLATNVLASGTPKLKFETYSTEKAIIAIENNDENALLTIENEDGDVVYYREGNITDKTYSKIFNFKNLSNGYYKATVKNNVGEHTLNFTVKGDEIKLTETTSAPYFNVANNLLKLSYLNSNQEPVSLTLLMDNEEVYNKYLGEKFSINAGFNISRLEKGNYTVVLSNGDNSFSYNFKK